MTNRNMHHQLSATLLFLSFFFFFFFCSRPPTLHFSLLLLLIIPFIGFGFAEFEDPKDAEDAIREMDGLT